jgi:hypothetical protein
VSHEQRALRELARLYGVQESYKNVFGKRVHAGVDNTIAVLQAMGAPGGGGGAGPGRAAPPPARCGFGRRSSPDVRSSP